MLRAKYIGIHVGPPRISTVASRIKSTTITCWKNDSSKTKSGNNSDKKTCSYISNTDKCPNNKHQQS